MTTPTKTADEVCGYINDRNRHCGRDAEHRITTVREGGQPAGPDPYSDEAFACETHLAAMLGCQPEAERQEEIYWEVRAI